MPDNFTELCETASGGDCELIRRIVGEQPELVRQHLDGDQPIHFAVRSAQSEAVETLLELGADPLCGIYPFREMTTALAIARDRELHEVAEVIEDWLADQHGTSSSGEEICAATANGNLEKVREMLDRDAKLIEATDAHGETPLFKAVRRADVGLVRELLARDVKIDRTNANGARPIHLALLHNWKAPDDGYKAYSTIAGMLIEAGVEYDAWVACAIGDVPNARKSLDAHDNLEDLFTSRDMMFRDINNPLIVACFQGHVRIVELLLDLGADPDAPFEIDEPDGPVKQWGHPLWIAACRNHYEVVELLLDRGARINTSVYASGPAVSVAEFQGHTRLAEMMHLRGATGDLLTYCVTKNFAAIAELVKREKTKPRELMWSAILAGNIEVVRNVLKSAPKFSKRNWFDFLFQTVRGWRLADIKVDNEGFDPRDYVRIFELLLEHRADVNLRSDRGNQTIAHFVCSDWGSYQNGLGFTVDDRLEFMRVLCRHNADLQARDDDLCSTPIAWAARFGHIEVVQFLLEQGVPAALDDDPPWATAKCWAKKNGHDDIVHALDSRL